MIKQSLLVLVLAGACGGGAKSTTTTTGIGGVPPASQCDLTARHMTDAVFSWKEPPPASKDDVFAVLKQHCDEDKWSAEAMTCFQGVTDADSAKPCAEKLTQDQHEKVMGAMMAKFDHRHHDEAAAPGGGAPPPPAEGADPCEGGE